MVFDDRINIQDMDAQDTNAMICPHTGDVFLQLPFSQWYAANGSTLQLKESPQEMTNTEEMLPPNDSLLRQPLELLGRMLAFNLAGREMYIRDSGRYTMAVCVPRCWCKRWQMLLDSWLSFDTP